MAFSQSETLPSSLNVKIILRTLEYLLGGGDMQRLHFPRFSVQQYRKMGTSSIFVNIRQTSKFQEGNIPKERNQHIVFVPYTRDHSRLSTYMDPFNSANNFVI